MLGETKGLYLVTLLTIFRRVLCNIQAKTNQICSPLKTANQSTLNEAHVIEKTKACTVAFMKRRNSWLFDIERNVTIRKKTEDGEIYCLKLQPIDFR